LKASTITTEGCINAKMQSVIAAWQNEPIVLLTGKTSEVRLIQHYEAAAPFRDASSPFERSMQSAAKPPGD
jgi:hypothetical protein